MSFSDGDQEGSFVAIFVLLIIWWFTFIPKTFQSYGKTDEEGENVRVSRHNRQCDLSPFLISAMIIANKGLSCK